MVGKRQLNKLKQKEKNKNILALCAAVENSNDENIVENTDNVSNLESNLEIIEFHENGWFKAKVYINPENFFNEPIPSKVLRIYLVNPGLYYEELFRTDQIYAKLLNIPYKNKQLIIPLVHTCL